MAFTVPDVQSAAYQDLARLLSADLEALARGIRGEGVLTGCEVTATSPPSSRVGVASGSVRVAGADVNVSPTTVEMGSASSLPRVDLLVVDAMGTVVAVSGSPSQSPVVTLPGSAVPIALVLRLANDDIISTGQMVDKRVTIEKRWKYVHDQTVPATVWSVTHGLGGFPSVTAQDSSGRVVHGAVRYIDANTVEVIFSVALAGKLGLS